MAVSKIFMVMAGMAVVFGHGLGMAHSKVDGQLMGKANGSAWVQAYHTRVRLIAGEFSRDGQKLSYSAGIHIELDKGWKTYWRTPGGAGGVPPYFSWEGSKNLKSANVKYPAPSRIVSDDGTSIGYKGEVVFPIDIEAIDPDKPVELALRLDYGVCKDICVPVQADLGLAFQVVRTGRGSFGRLDGQLLKRYSQKVPVRVENSAKGDPAIKHIEIDLEGPHPRLVVDAKFPMGVKGADLFVEAPDGLYIALPDRVSQDGGKGMRFLIDLSKGEDPKYFLGKELRLTLIGAGRQMESRWRVPSK